MNTLTQPFLRATLTTGTEVCLTLPGALSALWDDRIGGFKALRPHQRHAWHAFLVQVGALALLRAGAKDAVGGEEAWRLLLRGLTSEYADDAPWCLVGPPDRPGLLQPPLPDGLDGFKSWLATPDALDMLVTAKNHDVKAAVMSDAKADDWLFALLTLQTMEGFLGAGNYGISRMNGGFANRPAIGVAPPGGPGAHMRRDIRCLLRLRGRPPGSEGCAEENGLALVWLEPWDGSTSLPFSRLDPLYIEICRRVRLSEIDGRIIALTAGSKVPRVVPQHGGVTGDPWSPRIIEKDGSAKILTVDASGFHYRRIVELMFSPAVQRAPLQMLDDNDPPGGLTLVARALTRGQGKTEGYHERRIPLSRQTRRLMGAAATDRAAAMATERVALVASMASALRFGLLALLENGPEAVDTRSESAKRKALPYLNRFEAAVDRDFFPALWREFDLDDVGARHAERRTWVAELLAAARAVLDDAEYAAPKASRLRYRARVRGQAALTASAWRNEKLSPYLKEVQDDAA